MALTNFIPTVWSARLQENLHKALVYASVADTQYEGDVRNMGDTVKIGAIGPITVSSYTRNTTISSPQTLAAADGILAIDQGKYFNFAVDDADKAQMNVDVMDAAMREAAYAVGDAIDQYIAAFHSQAGNTIGSDGSPIVPTPSTAGTAAYEYLVDAGVLLDEDNVPSEGRWAIVPPWFYGMLQKDNRFVANAGLPGESALRNGIVGEAAGFQIRKSNNVVNTSATKYKLLCGGIGAIAFVGQVTEIEGYRPPDRFADAVKGLFIYGGKVVYSNKLVCLTANKT